MGKLYKVQVGAFSIKENAERRRDIVKNRGFSAIVIEEDGLYKVQSGAFSKKENAQKRYDELVAQKFKATIKVYDSDASSSEAAAGTSDWDKVLAQFKKFMAAKDPHQAVIDALARHGKTLKRSTAWCTETITAAFWEAGCLDLIGGINFQQSKKLKETAKAMGTWHSGKDGIKAGDIVIFGSEPNHSEIAIDETYDISGNYNGTVAKRKRNRGSTINGYIRPKYKTYTSESSGTKAETESSGTSTSKFNPIRFWFMKFWASNPDHIYGDASLFIEYDDSGKIVRTVLVDTGMNKSDTIKLLEKAKVTFLSVVIASHDHGDHVGFLSTILDKFPVGMVIFPNQDGVAKYQKKKYADRIYSLASKAKEKGAAVVYMEPGKDYSIDGFMKFRCLWQADATKLTEHDGHHFINDMSPECQMVIYPGSGHEWKFRLAGDLSRKAGGLQLMLKAVGDKIKADFAKFNWHADVYGSNTDLIKAVGAKVWFSNYHHKPSWGGRSKTYGWAQDGGAEVFSNYGDGEVYVDITASGGVSKAEVYCSANSRKKTYTKGTPKKEEAATETATKKEEAATSTKVKGWKKYMVRLTTKVSPSELDADTLVVVEFDDYTDSEIAKLKATGATVLAYLSVGTAEKDRPKAWAKLKDYCLEQLEDWENEYYLDLRKEGARAWMKERTAELVKRGADGIWGDNIDLYEYYPSTEMYNAINDTLTMIHKATGLVNVNGGIKYLTKAMNKDGSKYQGIGNVDIVVQEEVFSRITSYKGDGKFATQESKQSTEYQDHLKRCKRHKMLPALLEYTTDNTVKLRIKAFCDSVGALACVSGKLNL